MVLKSITIVLKTIMLFKSKLKKREDLYSSGVIGSYFVEEYQLENLT